MISIHHHVGRLMEFRFQQVITTLEMKAFPTRMSELVVKAGRSLVFIVDFRDCEPVEKEIEAMFVGQVRSDNWVVERSGFILPPAGPVTTQLERVISLGRNPERRAFRGEADLLAWLSPVMSPEEHQRSKLFLSERA